MQAELSSRTDLQGTCFPSATRCPSGATHMPPSPGPSTPAPAPPDSFNAHDARAGRGVGVGDALAASEELQVALEAIGRPQRVLLPVVVVTVFHTVHILPLTTVLTTVLAHSPARLRQWLLVPLDRDAWEHCQ